MSGENEVELLQLTFEKGALLTEHMKWLLLREMRRIPDMPDFDEKYKGTIEWLACAFGLSDSYPYKQAFGGGKPT